MLKTLLPFAEIPQLAKTDVAYVCGDEQLAPFYEHAPRMASFDAVMTAKSRSSYPRADLLAVLKDQYSGLPEREKVLRNIEALASEGTFTIVTAHQPSLFLGPLYYLYKALTVINLAEAAEQNDAQHRRIIPVFVIGSEDHDFEELNGINLFNRRLVWQTEAKGAVGSMSTEGLAPVLAELAGILGESDAARQLFARVEAAYAGRPTIAAATQAMLHDLFGQFGLVVLDMNDARLKKHFIPVLKAELLERPSFGIVNDITAKLNACGFKTQATPREINLFYMLPGLRERIVFENGIYRVLNTDIAFDEAQILVEVDTHPERFSPNVVLRPLYQEMILPNLAYVGGGGEIAYWLERLPLFRHFGVPFPMLVRRHSVLWLDRDAARKLRKFGFDAGRFFADADALVRTYVESQAAVEVSLEQETEALRRLYDSLTEKAKAIDPTLEKAVRADEAKAVAGLEHWQGRLVRAEKQKHEVVVNQIQALKEKLFPARGLQERFDNFMPYLLKYGDRFIAELKSNLHPFDPGFVVLEEEE